MDSNKLSIVWFRQDLRVHDNPALLAAASRGEVLPIYLLDDTSAGAWAMGAASRVWLKASLASLQQSLHGRLQFFKGDAQSVIERLIETLDVDAVYWNRCYEPWRIKRDAQIKARLGELGIHAQSENASLLWEPWTITKQDGSPYRVYGPYYRHGCLRAPTPREPLPQPPRLDLYAGHIRASCELEQLALSQGNDWQRRLEGSWQVGEAAAYLQLEDFCAHRLSAYRHGRDFPAAQHTSLLSPHLHFGEISPQQVWHRTNQASMHINSDDPAHFLSEIAWREFAYYQLFHFPHIPEKPFKPRYAGFPWRTDAPALRQWQRGQTGFPIVDAGMRELWQTGYMHNRVRMIVASFLVKNQLIHWREGAHWFWDCLVDADLASNSASWQWCAGCGVDAAAYYRIFNPLLQSEKFDPGGEYLVRYCPELGGLPVKFRHKPWLAGEDVLAEAGIVLGVDYPLPILDLKVTRLRALEANRRLGD